MNALTTDALIDDLRRLHLLEPDQLDELTRSPSQFPSDAKALAQYLMQRGWITPYQVNRLLVGRGQELLLGSYVMLERLGEGGMGAVFKARNWKLGALRALKIIRKDRTTQTIAVQRFQREMRAAAQLSHPNVVHSHDADEVDGVHYIAMELLSGLDLARRVADGGPLPVQQACEYIRQAALGLQHAHECGLVHRDVKPSNLLVTTAGVVKILDLGLARLAPSGEGSESSGTLTQPDSLMGTPDYMAPEQARHSHGVDGRADLYSLGATMYFLLTGQPPIPKGPLAATIAALLFNDPTPVESLRPDIPAPVARVVRKLMAKKPEDRFQSGAELEESLAAILAGKAGEATAPYMILDETVPPSQPAAGDVDTLAGPITVPASVPAQPVSAPRWRIRPIYIAVPLAVAILVLGTAALFKIVTSLPSANPPPAPGKFTLRCDDPDVRVLLRRKGATEPVEIKANESMTLAAADYDLELAPGALPGLRLSHPVLRLKPGAEETVRVEGFPLKADALVSRPGWIEGVRTWTIEPRDKALVLNPLAYSPDGRWLAGGAADGSIRLLDGRTGAPIRTLIGHTDRVRALAWSPVQDKPVLASAGMDGSIRLWNPQAGALPFRQNLDAAALAFSPDGKTLAVGADKDIYLWNLANQKQLLLPRKHSTPLRVLVWAPDGKTLASASSVHVQFWHAPDVNHEDWTNDKLLGHIGAVHGLAWSPDSSTAASAGADGTIQLWNLSALNGPAKTLTGPKAEVLGVSWIGADADTIASIGGDSNLRFWDPTTGELRRSVPCGLNAGKFSADGALLIAPGPGWTVRLSDTSSGRPLGSALVTARGTLILSEDGHYRCYADRPAIEQAIIDQLTYIVQTDKGQMKYTPVQFAAQFGWKNEPDRARLDTR